MHGRESYRRSKKPNDRTRTNLPKSLFVVNDSLFSQEAVTQNEEKLSKQQSRTFALIDSEDK